MSFDPPRTPGNPGGLLATAVADLEDAVARLAELTADGALVEVPGAALTRLAETLHRALDRGAAVATVATGVVHDSGTLAADGFASTKAWLAGPCRKSETESKVLLASSTALRRDYPATAGAWLAGDVSGGAVREITRGITLAVRALPVAERAVQAGRAEAVLLDLARRSPVADVARAGKYLRFVADPDGARQAQLDAYDDQQLTLTPAGAGFQLSGYLDAETAAKLTTALDGIVDGWHRAGSLTAEDQPGGHGPLDGLRRRQRRPHLLALALGHLATRFLDDGLLGTRHGVKPHVALTVDADHVIAGLGGELLIPGREQPVLLPSESIRRILCDADLHPVITTRPTGAGGCGRTDGRDSVSGTDAYAAGTADADAAGAVGRWQAALLDRLRDRSRGVLYLGRTQRTVTARLRRALEVRDRHCAFPGCHVDVSRTHGHHVREWEDGGETAISNTVLLCVRHHHAVHEGGWTITPTDGIDPHATGCWTFTPPVRRARP